MDDLTELASGLRFPEGPVVMDDGSVVVVEIAAGRVTRVCEDGRIETVAEPGGGPNGAALGPDGALYVANNGGSFQYREAGGLLVPLPDLPADYSGGRIERVDLATGEVTVLYTECGGHPLLSPNDLVFDSAGNFWFTDHGTKTPRLERRGGIYYASPDGSMIREVVQPVDSANGIALSPDATVLYVAETHTGRVYRWDVPAPGEVAGGGPLGGGMLVAGLPGLQLLDSMAVEADGNIVVATIMNGGLTVISPDGSSVTHVPLPDLVVTNVAFGGPNRRTAYVTLSSTGRLVSMPWPRPGLALKGGSKLPPLEPPSP